MVRSGQLFDLGGRIGCRARGKKRARAPALQYLSPGLASLLGQPGRLSLRELWRCWRTAGSLRLRSGQALARLRAFGMTRAGMGARAKSNGVKVKVKSKATS